MTVKDSTSRLTLHVRHKRSIQFHGLTKGQCHFINSWEISKAINIGKKNTYTYWIVGI